MAKQANDAYVVGPISLGNGVSQDLNPQAGGGSTTNEIVVHTIKVPALSLIQLIWTDGGNFEIFEVLSNSLYSIAIHCTNSKWMQLKNAGIGGAVLVGASGMFTK